MTDMERLSDVIAAVIENNGFGFDFFNAEMIVFRAFAKMLRQENIGRIEIDKAGAGDLNIV